MSEPQSATVDADSVVAVRSSNPSVRLSDLSPQQWKGGVAAWLGWLFDGLDMHLYTLVATPFVAELLGDVRTNDPSVPYHASLIQAAFLLGWALGGGFFGIVGDRIGRTRALMLTILVYAAFTGLSFFAQAWWHLLIFRFIAALGIGGEWAVGASLLSETWPKRWRPWMAAVLQTAVNCGIILASITIYLMQGLPPRWVFLVGIVPALLVLWIRRAVPETEEWHTARQEQQENAPRFADLFRGDLRRTTWLVLGVCGLGLTGHWAIMYWFNQHMRNLPEVASWTAAQKDALTSQAMTVNMIGSIAGNFLAAFIACRLGYRRTIALMCVAYFISVASAYAVPRPHGELWLWLAMMGGCSGLFALFTMYLPPLFPTLLRTTGAGFCYNFGRVAAAAGTVVFGLFNKVGDFRTALLLAGCLFLPAGALAWALPELRDDEASPQHEPVE